MTSTGDGEAARRRERREWIRDHHPDRGGDPQVFAEGLRARGGDPARVRPEVRRTRRIRRALRKFRKVLKRRLFRRRNIRRVR